LGKIPDIWTNQNPTQYMAKSKIHEEEKIHKATENNNTTPIWNYIKKYRNKPMTKHQPIKTET